MLLFNSHDAALESLSLHPVRIIYSKSRALVTVGSKWACRRSSNPVVHGAHVVDLLASMAPCLDAGEHGCGPGVGRDVDRKDAVACTPTRGLSNYQYTIWSSRNC